MKKHDTSLLENRLRNFFFFFLLVGENFKRQIKTTTGKGGWGGDYSMHFMFYKSSLVFWFSSEESFFFFFFFYIKRDTSEVQSVQYGLEESNGSRWKMLGCSSSSGGGGDGAFSIFGDSSCHQSGFLPPSAAELRRSEM